MAMCSGHFHKIVHEPLPNNYISGIRFNNASIFDFQIDRRDNL